MARDGVLHFEHNGVGVILSEALRRQGYRSLVVASQPHPFGFREDVLLSPRTGVLGDALRWWTWRRLRDYRVFHNHGEALPGTARRRWPGHIVQHYHDRVVSAPIAAPADVSLVSMPGNLRTVPSAVWLPLPVRTDVFTPEPERSTAVVRVGFCGDASDPRKPSLIPMSEIAATIASSGGRAQAFPMKGLEYTHSNIRQYYSSIDVWVDRIGAGFYGLSAIEAASCGVPVVTQIGDFEAEFARDCPFISVNREGVQAALASLITDEPARVELAAKSRQYVVRVHDADSAARTLLGIYQRLG